jgi:tetratricopeptide (TPR) repeat protein
MKISVILLSIFLLFAVVSPFLHADTIHNDAALDQSIVHANELFLNARLDEGIEVIRQLEKTHPDSPAVPFFTANGYWWKIFRAYIYDKDDPTPDFDKNFDYYLNQTIDRCEKLLKKNEKDEQALFYLGNAYSLRSRVKGLRGSYFSAGRDAAKGKYYLEEVLKINPQQYDSYYNLGVYNYFASTLPGFAKVLKALLFLPGGNRSKGLTLLRTAGEKSLYFAEESQLILARFYTEFEERPYDALRIIDGFYKKHPDNAWYHYWLGTLYSDEINDYYQAATIYRQILDKCNAGVPNYTVEVKNQAWLKLVRAENKQLFPETAIDEIHRLLASKPSKPSYILPRSYLELGNIYDSIGMRSNAVQAYKQVLSLPDYRDYHDQAKKLLQQDYNQTAANIYRANLEGRRFAIAGEYAAAEASFKKVLQQYPDNEQTLLAIGEMQFMKGDFGEATDTLNKILDRRPKEPKWLLAGTYVRLGQVYEARKQASAAKALYEKALETKYLASDDRNIAKRALRMIAEMKSTE